jgi:hypothetical protein
MCRDRINGGLTNSWNSACIFTHVSKTPVYKQQKHVCCAMADTCVSSIADVHKTFAWRVSMAQSYICTIYCSFKVKIPPKIKSQPYITSIHWSIFVIMPRGREIPTYLIILYNNYPMPAM